MVDITQHIKVRAMQHNPDSYRIGIMRADFCGTMGGIRPRDAVLFRDATYENGTYVIELPMSDEMIAKQQERGSLITTICCCIGVKTKYVEEIKCDGVERIFATR